MHARFPTTALEEKDSPHMKSGGLCSEEGIRFRCDGSLSDPVYMAHESGHLMALGGDHAARNIVELQAFFVQEAAYDFLIQKGEPLARQARIHRLEEYTGLTARINRAMRILETVADNPNDEQDHDVWYMHGHPFAALVTISIYENFLKMTSAQKAAALEVLYEGGAQTTYHDILGSFGVADLRQAGRHAWKNLQDEAKALGFYRAPEQKAVPGSKPIP